MPLGRAADLVLPLRVSKPIGSTFGATCGPSVANGEFNCNSNLNPEEHRYDEAQ
jgi:hypothetical protein